MRRVHKGRWIPGIDGTMTRPFWVPSCGNQTPIVDMSDFDEDVTCLKCRKSLDRARPAVLVPQ